MFVMCVCVCVCVCVCMCVCACVCVSVCVTGFESLAIDPAPGRLTKQRRNSFSGHETHRGKGERKK